MLGETLSEVCSAASFDPSIEEITFTDTTWNGEPACEVHPSESLINDLPTKGLILPHPVPFNFQGETISFVAVFATPEHFDAIVSTVSFHVGGLSASQIVHSVLDVVEVNSYYADGVDWEGLHAAANELGPMGEAGRFIEFELLPALRAEGDNHSFLMPNIDPGRGGSWPSGVEVPSGEMRGSLGYIEIPSGALPGEMVPYVEAGIEVVTDLAPQACGWIIDLRGNTGGSVPIMVHPLLPFFPEGRLFGFEGGSGEESWILREGDRLVTDNGIQYGPMVDTPLPELPNPDAPIAVLISDDTGSAGEYTLLTLMGRETTRTFGQSTGGYTTGNAGFTMLDGSMLALAGAAAMDVHGNVYTGKVEPDERIMSQSRGGGAQGNDDTILAAEAWLLSQPACQDATPAASPVS
jgi:carboxyl-terminal processing protease